MLSASCLQRGKSCAASGGEAQAGPQQDYDSLENAFRQRRRYHLSDEIVWHGEPGSGLSSTGVSNAAIQTWSRI